MHHFISKTIFTTQSMSAFFEISSFSCFRQNIVVQLQDIRSSHLEAFSNLGIPPISDKSYILKILENTLANGYCNIEQIPF